MNDNQTARISSGMTAVPSDERAGARPTHLVSKPMLKPSYIGNNPPMMQPSHDQMPGISSNAPITSSSEPGINKPTPTNSAENTLNRRSNRASGLWEAAKRSTRGPGGFDRESMLSTVFDGPTIPPKAAVDASDRLRFDDLDLDMIPEVNLPGFTPLTADNAESVYSADISEASTPASAFKPQPVMPRSMITDMTLSPLHGRLQDLEGNQSIQRKRSLSRPERRRSAQSWLPRQDLLATGGIGQNNTPLFLQARDAKVKSEEEAQDEQACCGRSTWRFFASCLTFYAPDTILASCCGMKNPNLRQAWREKMALVTIIIFLCIILGFITFGFQALVCNSQISNFYPVGQAPSNINSVNINGFIYNLQGFLHKGKKKDMESYKGGDFTYMFPMTEEVAREIYKTQSACAGMNMYPTPNLATCTASNVAADKFCHTGNQFIELIRADRMMGYVSYTWEELQDSATLLVFNGIVINLERYFNSPNAFGGTFDDLLNSNLGKDATRVFTRSSDDSKKMLCLAEKYRVGVLDKQSPGCFASSAFTYLSFAVILSVIVIRFILALIFNWFLYRKLGVPPAVPMVEAEETKEPDLTREPMKRGVEPIKSSNRNSVIPTKSRFSSQYNTQVRYNTPAPAFKDNATAVSKRASIMPAQPEVNIIQSDSVEPGILRTIMLVTCYSEGEQGLRTTLDSLARTDFPDSHKLLFVIADGMIRGAGNSKSTPDILIDMIDLDSQFPQEPEAYSYVAIADGRKRHNMAKVYAGRYYVDGHSVPMILVVKCGTPEEQRDPKPGNRGKRDSQIILMQFLSKVMFDDRLTPLEFDIFTKMTAVGCPKGTPLDQQKHRITPDQYELVLMVDADTKVMPESLRPMSYTMASDPRVMGLCGETRIANKTASVVSSIQVFEYYLAHHLAKSFESVFGSVTCLPGCFCMYRIKAPKAELDADGNQYYVPILANPDIVSSYSENVVDTLHKKNLLLLGEDRYLSTLMLKTFPKRRMVFVPQAVCKTIVPDEFRVLLSQRRRWINSTIHNLLELVTLRDLCGIFCFSMQFIIFMELVGTAVLPAAISFTIYLCIQSVLITLFPFLIATLGPLPTVPLALLGAILGLPAVLICLSSRRWAYLMWMMIYLFSLPIWNFVMPVYAYWHFDDFSWGETRKVEGAQGDKGHGDKEGEFDHTKIVMKRWAEYERDRRRFATLNRLQGRVGATVEEDLLFQ